MLRKLSVLLLGFLLVISTVAPVKEAAAARAFKDVPDSFWSGKEIVYLSNSSIIKGYQDETFRPNNNVTNSQVATMLSKALKLNVHNLPNPGYTDVNSKHHAYKEIAAAAAVGIFPKGGKFNPESPITRESMARAIANAFKLTGTSKAGFTDVPSSYWAHQYITKLAANRIVIGYPDKTFKPKNKVTRAQFSAFVARALNDSFKTQDIEEYRNQYRIITKGLKLNPAKTYQYQMNWDDYRGKGTWMYTGKSDGWENWTVTLNTGEKEYYSYFEDRTRMAFGIQQSEVIHDIHYPLTLNSKWTYEYGGDVDQYIVTSTTKTVTTPAGTFKNVIEIKNSAGYYTYYAEGVGHILTIDATVKPNRKTVELLRYY